MGTLDHTTVIYYKPGDIIAGVVGVTFTSSEPRGLRLPISVTYEELKLLIRERMGCEISEIMYRAPLSIHPLRYGCFLVEDDNSVQMMLYAHQRSQLNFIELFVCKENTFTPVGFIGDLGDALGDALE